MRRCMQGHSIAVDSAVSESCPTQTIKSAVMPRAVIRSADHVCMLHLSNGVGIQLPDNKM